MEKTSLISVMFVLPAVSFGGAERVMLNLLGQIDTGRFNPYLVVGDANGEFVGDIPAHIKVIDLQCKRVRWMIFKLVPLIRKMKPHIVFSTLGYLNVMIMMARFLMPRSCIFIGREANIPSIQLPLIKYSAIFRYMYRVLYPKFDMIICQSDDMYVDMMDHFCISPEKIHVIHNPVDTEAITRKAVIKKAVLFHKRFNLVSVGKLKHQKGFDLLIKALALTRNKEICLTIIGEGPCREMLTSLTRELGIGDRINFHGYEPNPYAYMAAADLFVLSSRYEGFPNVVLEAMACGVPVLSMNCPGGVDQIIEHEVTGWIVPNGDIEKLAKAMDIAFEQNLDKRRIQRSVQGKFGIEKITDQYEQVFVSCLRPERKIRSGK